MTPVEFLARYDKRVRRYARYTSRNFGVPSHYIPDLHQACYIGICAKLKQWKPALGASAFNFCSGTMRLHMMAEIRRIASNKPFGWRREIVHFVEPTGEREFSDPKTPNLDLRIDLQRIIEADRHPIQMQRFIRIAFDPKCGEDLATELQCTRQTISHAVCLAAKRLRKTCREYA